MTEPAPGHRSAQPLAAPLEPRLHAARPDIADIRLQGRVSAARFVEGARWRVAAPTAALHMRPDPGSEVAATRRRGEPLRVFERDGGWAWAQSAADGYVGYVAEASLADGWLAPEALDHGLARVGALRAHLYPAPDLKTPPIGWAPLGAWLAVAAESDDVSGFARLSPPEPPGWVYRRHLAAGPTEDWVAVAERLIGVPYLWGGESADGVDCSGLIKIALEAAGRSAPRDSDLQEAALGGSIDPDAQARRGDLLFWRGHVGVLRAPDIFLHANAWSMSVLSEPVAATITRLEALGLGPPRRRRL